MSFVPDGLCLSPARSPGTGITWSRDGEQLDFQDTAGALMAVDVQPQGSEFHAGGAAADFHGDRRRPSAGHRTGRTDSGRAAAGAGDFFADYTGIEWGRGDQEVISESLRRAALNRQPRAAVST